MLKGGGTVRLQQDYNNDRGVTSSINVGATATVAYYLNGPSSAQSCGSPDIAKGDEALKRSDTKLDSFRNRRYEKSRNITN